MKRIGVFGGSFNPPHLGHLLAAVYALKIFDLDEVWFVPVFRHAFGKSLAPFSMRIQMCKLLLANLSPKFQVSDIEKRLRASGATLYTLEALKKKYPRCRFSLIIGSDILKETKRWHRFSEIRRKFGVLVVPRIPNLSSTQARSGRSKLTKDVALFVKKNHPYDH